MTVANAAGNSDVRQPDVEDHGGGVEEREGATDVPRPPPQDSVVLVRSESVVASRSELSDDGEGLTAEAFLEEGVTLDLEPVDVDVDLAAEAPAAAEGRVERQSTVRALTRRGDEDSSESGGVDWDATMELDWNDIHTEGLRRSAPPPPRASRSVPPLRPSVRGRGRNTPVPPVRPSVRASLPAPAAATAGLDELRWMLADRTLQLGRTRRELAQAQAQLSERDARVRALEAQLEKLLSNEEPAAPSGPSEDPSAAQ